MGLFRIAPAGPPQAYQTYGMSMPAKSHWVPATCEDVDCEAYLRGWVSVFDLSTDLGHRQYFYCTHDNTRSFTEERTGSLVKLFYPAGNTCFRAAEHKLPVRPPRLYVKGGDWRGNPSGFSRVHTRPEDWVEDFAEHQEMLRELIERG